MEDIDKYEILSSVASLENNHEVSESKPMPKANCVMTNMKPIDEVKIMLSGIIKDMSSVKSDMAVIKNRLYELQRENRLLKEEKFHNSNKWGFGFY